MEWSIFGYTLLWSNWINIFGLSFDIFGATILAKTIILEKEDSILSESQYLVAAMLGGGYKLKPTVVNNRIEQKYNGYIGLGILIEGFLIQIFSNLNSFINEIKPFYILIGFIIIALLLLFVMNRRQKRFTISFYKNYFQNEKGLLNVEEFKDFFSFLKKTFRKEKSLLAKLEVKLNDISRRNDCNKILSNRMSEKFLILYPDLLEMDSPFKSKLEDIYRNRKHPDRGSSSDEGDILEGFLRVQLDLSETIKAEIQNFIDMHELYWILSKINNEKVNSFYIYQQAFILRILEYY